MKLSHSARLLWAKKARDGSMRYLPLVTHMEDSAALARLVWRNWLTSGVRKSITLAMQCSDDDAEKLLVFCSAAHDIGKATALFQSKQSAFPANELDKRLYERTLDSGLTIKPYNTFTQPSATPHALASQLILEREDVFVEICSIIGAHHGRPPSEKALLDGSIQSRCENYCGSRVGRKAWQAVWDELFNYAVSLAGVESAEDMPIPDMATQLLLSGVLVMVDWLASDESRFAYIDIDERVHQGIGEARANAAFDKSVFLHTGWRAAATGEGLFEKRFRFSPRPIQSAAVVAAEEVSSPGIFIIEGTMGVGKTEAALAAAEILGARAKRSGVFFALPTQATSDGIFPRMLDWISGFDGGSHSVELVHAKAQFNHDKRRLKLSCSASGIFEDNDTTTEDTPYDENKNPSLPVVYDWFEGRKTALLADFAVGTVDGLLQAALQQRHVMLRHLGFTNKVVIVDECHAYDAYMCVYLERALRWLGKYGVPVILLSATLPCERAASLIAAYSSVNKEETTAALEAASYGRDTGASNYPRITYTDGEEIKRIYARDTTARKVKIEYICDDEIADTLADRLRNGGCAGVILNSVSRAQETANVLRERFGENTVRLLHSRFTATDRLRIEEELRQELGKPIPTNPRPRLRIVVGTQVLEQSLDLDFDIMITDLAPMDLILQRMGRLHRHERKRPKGLEKAVCLILGARGGETDKTGKEDKKGGLFDGFDSASVAIYGRYLLIRTRLLLPNTVCLPVDIPSLVEMVYGDDGHLPREILDSQDYETATADWRKRQADKENNAKRFTLPSPNSGENIVGILDGAVGDAAGEASVRDIEDSIEVVAVGRRADGGAYLLSGGTVGASVRLPIETPDEKTAMAIARECLRLPPVLCRKYKLNDVIAELEKRTLMDYPLWRRSPWLRDSLILTFDEGGCTELCGYALSYNRTNGLTYEKEEKNGAT